jgi:hypothetical protein
MSKPLDIEAMKKEAETKKAEGRPFLFPKAPEKNKQFAYRVKRDGELRKAPFKSGDAPIIDVVLLESVNDSTFEKNAKVTLVLSHDVLKKKMEEIGFFTTPNATADLMNAGKPKNKKYYDYVVIKRDVAEFAPLSQILHRKC